MSSPSSNPLSPALATKVPGSKRNAESFEFRDFTMRQAASGQRLNTDSCVFGGIVGLGLHPKRIIDIGTGTGIVALMLAARYPGVEILAVEPEVEIATIAVDNFKRSPWTEQLNVLTSRAQDLHESKCGQFDFITLNPPYFLHGTQSPDYLRAVARHAFSLGPADIFSVFVRLMTREGSAWISCPTDSISEWMAAGQSAGFYCTDQIFIYDHPQAKSHIVVSGWSHIESRLATSKIFYRDEPQGGRSAWMKEFRSLWYPDRYND